MIKNIHFVTYADGRSRMNGNEYSKTQKLLIGSIENNTKYNVVFHTHNLETIKQKKWFDIISDLPNLPHDDVWDRGGYYNAWKPLLIKEVYDSMGDDDLLYYVDSSGYHQIGFQYKIDNLLEYAHLHKNVCGSFGYDLKNNTFNCCDNIKVWNIVCANNEIDFNNILNKPHILNSWFVFAKDKKNYDFINEWSALVNTKLNNIPLIVFHHTVDQGLFNILVYKYAFNSFFNNKTHNENKNHNLVHKEIQNLNKDEMQKYFINPINF